MNCPICGRTTVGGGMCPDCARDERFEDALNTCSADGCYDETAYCSPFCPTHDQEVDA